MIPADGWFAVLTDVVDGTAVARVEKVVAWCETTKGIARPMLTLDPANPYVAKAFSRSEHPPDGLRLERVVYLVGDDDAAFEEMEAYAEEQCRQRRQDEIG